MPKSDKRQATIFGEMQNHDRYRGQDPIAFLFDLFQEAVESASGGSGLSGYIPLAEDGKEIDKNAGSLAVAAAIAYAGKEIAEAIRSLGPEIASSIQDAMSGD